MSNANFDRDTDGVLVPKPGRVYHSPVPNEAIKTLLDGKLTLGCNASVHDTWSSGPCGNTPKHDPDANGRYTKCGVHSAAAVAKRKAKQEQARVRWRLEYDAKDALRKAEEALEQALTRIAAGHNDARSVALDALKDLLDARDAIAKAKGKS